MQRPFFSQSPKRVGSGPLRPPISVVGPLASPDAVSSPGAGCGSESGTATLLSFLFEVITELCQMSDNPYSIIIVSGGDAEEFLQGQLTADLRKCPSPGPMRAAWCNPKGRVICILAVSKTADGFLLALPGELAEHVVQRLTMFRFRSKVVFELRSANPDELMDQDPQQEFAAWRLQRLCRGIAEIYGPQSEQFTPHMLNLDLLGAVDFEKGCYTGQEIVARTHYRGASKRRLHRFRSEQPVAAGAKVAAGNRNVGEVVNAIGTDLLAVVPIDKVDASLTIGAIKLTHIALDHLSV